MGSVRTNSLPSYRYGVAKDLEDCILKTCCEEIDLSSGLQPGRGNSSNGRDRYKLPSGQTLTIEQVSVRLSQREDPDQWNPHPEENKEFDWWSAIETCDLSREDHLNELTARFPPPDYRIVELLALKSKLNAADGKRTRAKELAMEAIEAAREGSWFKWLDGAAKKEAFAALKRVEPQDAVASARKEFGADLYSGKLSSNYLLSYIPETFEFLEIPWPIEEALEAVEDYIEHVLVAGIPVDTYSSLVLDPKETSADGALCGFLFYLLDFPAVDIGVAVRRCIGKFIARGGVALTDIQISDLVSHSLRLENFLIALHVGSIKNPGGAQHFEDFVVGLNQNESIAVRSVARRICELQGWQWAEVTNQSAPVKLIVPSGDILGATYEEAQMLVGGDLVSAAHLHEMIFRILQDWGHDLDTLR